MNQLQLCKLFAELEGVDVITLDDGSLWKCSGNSNSYVTELSGEFNPITNLALNCAARDKYEVHTDYINKSISIWYRGEFRDDMTCNVEIKTKEETPRAVIECILKSEGKL